MGQHAQCRAQVCCRDVAAQHQQSRLELLPGAARGVLGDVVELPDQGRQAVVAVQGGSAGLPPAPAAADQLPDTAGDDVVERLVLRLTVEHSIGSVEEAVDPGEGLADRLRTTQGDGSRSERAAHLGERTEPEGQREVLTNNVGRQSLGPGTRRWRALKGVEPAVIDVGELGERQDGQVVESDLRGASPVEGDLTEQRCARFDLQRRHCRSEQGERVGRFGVTVSRDRRLVRCVRAGRECSLPSQQLSLPPPQPVVPLVKEVGPLGQSLLLEPQLPLVGDGKGERSGVPVQLSRHVTSFVDVVFYYGTQ